MSPYDDPEIRDYCQRQFDMQERMAFEMERQRQTCKIENLPFARPYFFPAKDPRQK